jgi:hypothetical protein
VSSLRVNVDVHFGYGAVASFSGAVCLLIGLYVNESIGFLFLIGMTASYVGFHFAAMWVHQSQLDYRAESNVRAQRQDEYRQGLLERQMNPIRLEPVEAMDLELSSLRRTG